MNDKLMMYLKEKPIIVPKIIFNSYHKLNITEEEFVVLIYIMNASDKVVYNPDWFTKELGISKHHIMEIINSLVDKKILTIIIDKGDNNISEEYFSLDLFYHKLGNIILDKEVPSDNINSDLFTIFESEFGRTLSSMEYEKINSWLNDGVNKELIVEALKEATYNQVTNLRYIETIIYAWRKKGIKTREDVNKDRIRYKKSKSETTEVFDYDWVKDDNE